MVIAHNFIRHFESIFLGNHMVHIFGGALADLILRKVLLLR